MADSKRAIAAPDYSFRFARKLSRRGLVWRNPLSPRDVSQADPNKCAKYKQRDQCYWREPATLDRLRILLRCLGSINDIQFWLCNHSPSLCRLRDIRDELEHGKGATSSHRLVNGWCPARLLAGGECLAIDLQPAPPCILRGFSLPQCCAP